MDRDREDLSERRFLRTEVVPRRDAALAIAQEIEELNNANLAEQREEATRRHAAFRDDLRRLQTVLLGLVVALTVVFGLRVAERRSDEQRTIAEEAERQMRQLSQRLVATQEEERRSLSRELHDHPEHARRRVLYHPRAGAGARAYLLKEATDEDLLPAVRAVCAGKPFFSPAVAAVLVEDYMRTLQKRGLTDSYHVLTDREKKSCTCSPKVDRTGRSRPSSISGCPPSKPTARISCRN